MIKYIILIFVIGQSLKAQTLRSNMVMEIVNVKGHRTQLTHNFISYWIFLPDKIQLLLESPNGNVLTNYIVISKKDNEYICKAENGNSKITIYVHKKHITFVMPKKTLTYML